MLWMVLGGFALIAWIDLAPLIRRRKWRAVAAFACMFVLALTLGILTVFNVQIPSVMYAWGDFIRWIGLGYAS